MTEWEKKIFDEICGEICKHEICGEICKHSEYCEKAREPVSGIFEEGGCGHEWYIPKVRKCRHCGKIRKSYDEEEGGIE